MGINSTGYEVYGLPYLLLYADYDCFTLDGAPIERDTTLYQDKCSPNYFCTHDDITYKKVADSQYTLHNIID